MTSVLTIENIYEDEEFTKLSSVTMRILEAQVPCKELFESDLESEAVFYCAGSELYRFEDKEVLINRTGKNAQRIHYNSVSFIVPGAYAGVPLGS